MVLITKTPFKGYKYNNDFNNVKKNIKPIKKIKFVTDKVVVISQQQTNGVVTISNDLINKHFTKTIVQCEIYSRI